LWLEEVRQKLGVEKVSIAGLSLGGWMALRYATAYPESVEKLALLCPSGLARERRSFLWKSMLQKLRGGRGLEKSVRSVMGDSEISEGMRMALEYTALIAGNEKPRMAKMYLFSDAELKRLTMPILVLFGDGDIVLRAEESVRRISRIAPNVRSEILPNTGHAVVAQAERIFAFLRSSP
jgi:pimeloyl-ACP methyl ester carboxylesterase